MVPRWYQHVPVREGILKARKGPECTLGGHEPLWVYFKPKTVTLYFYFWRFFCKHPSWSLVGFLHMGGGDYEDALMDTPRLPLRVAREAQRGT